MSIVVAVRKAGRTAIASDSLTCFGPRRTAVENLRTDKIRRVGSSYLAMTGWGVYTNILDDFLAKRKRAPSLRDEAAIFDFFLRFWKALQERYPFVDNHFSEDDSPFTDLDASFLVVNKRGIFRVSNDLSVARFEQYDAIGSGADFALGALHTRYAQARDPHRLASDAVRSAIHFDVHCGGEVRAFEVR